jgi:ABC-type hemin transport system ATPase subunit
MVTSHQLGISTQADAIAIRGAGKKLKLAMSLELKPGKVSSAHGPNALSVPLKIYSGR